MLWLLCLLALFADLAKPSQAQGNQRVALLIGNASYTVGRLTNPPNDVREMQTALQAVGFKVQIVLNANQNQMKRAVRDFGAQAQGADVAFLYYSGHAAQARGENYLIPVQASIDKESDYEVEAVSANTIMAQIVGARPKAAIVVLDACRDNPLAATTKSASKGLGRMDAPTGTMIAFATAPNNTASDNGLYAQTLARQIRTPGLELLDVFRRTSAEVKRSSNNTQEPRISEVSINDSLYLAGTGTAASSRPVQTASVVPVPDLQPMPQPVPAPVAAQLVTAGVQAQTALDEAMKAKKITIAIPTDFPPYGFVGTDLQPQGLDIDMANYIAAKLGVAVQLVPVTGANRIAYLRAKKAELVISTLGKNPDREKVIDFTAAYSPYFQAIFAAKNISLKGFGDLAGKSVGVTRGSIEDQELTKLAPASADIKRFEDNNATVSAFVSGQVQTIGISVSEASKMMAMNPLLNTEYKLLLKESPNFIGVAKGEDKLRVKVNEIIAEGKKSGDIDRMANKWLGRPAGDLPQ